MKHNVSFFLFSSSSFPPVCLKLWRKSKKQPLSALLTTALSQMRAIRSSTPFTPSGIWVKSSLPMAFWATLNVQWALPVTLRSPLADEETEKHRETQSYDESLRSGSGDVCFLEAKQHGTGTGSNWNARPVPEFVLPAQTITNVSCFHWTI